MKELRTYIAKLRFTYLIISFSASLPVVQIVPPCLRFGFDTKTTEQEKNGFNSKYLQLVSYLLGIFCMSDCQMSNDTTA